MKLPVGFAKLHPCQRRGRRRAFTLVELPAVSGRKREAFTLVELLVVIGIIAVLIAILMPALNRARMSANQVKCQSNFRQIYYAISVYVNENKGVLPKASDPDGWGVSGTNADTFIQLSALLGTKVNDET